MIGELIATKRRIAIFQGARLDSKRVPRKLLQPVGGLTLLERGLRLLRDVSVATGATPIIACPPEDSVIAETAQIWGIEVVPATNGEGWVAAFSGIAKLLAGRFDWIIDANFLCRPFLSADTVQRIVNHAMRSERPFVVTCQHRGLLWDGGGRQIHGNGQVSDTKQNPVYQDLSHLGYGMPVAMLADEAAAAQAEPFPVVLRAVERIDVDTPDDLAFARMIHQ